MEETVLGLAIPEKRLESCLCSLWQISDKFKLAVSKAPIVGKDVQDTHAKRDDFIPVERSKSFDQVLKSSRPTEQLASAEGNKGIICSNRELSRSCSVEHIT